ncbi:MAG: matrixin family metalloprotease [Chitinophagaceae bacterium]|nr:MAG: matrixin family metalloprotease [Chitinophagaceae bacterium]
MKRMIRSFTLFGAFALLLSACKKEARGVASEEEVSPTVVAQIKNMGFRTDGIMKVEEGYLVEGDIVLTNEDLAGLPTSKEIVYANEEHYRTTNLVNASRYATITVALSNSSAQHEAAFSAALNEAIRRYNAEGLTIRFQRVSSRANITVNSYYQVSNVLGSAGFPGKNGSPYKQVKMNTYWYGIATTTTNVNYIATIMAHEIGHCIGFRHTDYMNRAYSCGGSTQNEGSAGIGAIHIQGTPTGPSAGSWMLACSDGRDQPFTSADRTALQNVY